MTEDLLKTNRELQDTVTRLVESHSAERRGEERRLTSALFECRCGTLDDAARVAEQEIYSVENWSGVSKAEVATRVAAAIRRLK